MVQKEASTSPSSDPLSEPARKERTLLLGFSFVGLLVSQLHILPTKIAVLGIDFNTNDQRTFVLILTGSLVYFLVVFVLYASSDYVRFKRANYVSLLQALADNVKRGNEFSKVYDPADLSSENKDLDKLFNEIDNREGKLRRFETPLGKLRLLMEFIFPVALALVSIVLLLIRVA